MWSESESGEPSVGMGVVPGKAELSEGAVSWERSVACEVRARDCRSPGLEYCCKPLGAAVELGAGCEASEGKDKGEARPLGVM